MAESVYRLPTDVGNTGKEFRTIDTPGGASGTVHARVTGLSDPAGNVLTFPTADPAAGTPAVPVRAAGPFAVTGPITRAQVDAAPIPVTWTGAPTVTISGTASVNVANANLVVRGQINVAGVGDAIPVILAGQSGSVAVTTGGLTNGELRAAPVTVAVNNFPASQPVSLASLPALSAGGNTIGKVDVNGTVPVTGAFYPATQPVSGPVTNAELRAVPLPVSGTLALSAGAAAIGSVSVSNFPTGFNVNNAVALAAGAAAIGSVSVSNFPASQAVTGAFFPATQPVSIAANTPDVTDRAARLLGVVSFSAGQSVTLAAGANAIGAVSVSNFPATQAVTLADNAARVLGVTDPSDRAARLLGVITDRTANSVAFSGTAGATAGTLTIPGTAGAFTYLEYLEVTLYSTAARTGVASPVTVTTTGITGTPALTFTSAGAIGTSERQVITASHPIKSSAVNTPIVITFPAVTGALWRVNAFYWTGS